MSKLDANQIIKESYDEVDSWNTLVVIGSPAVAENSKLDVNQILKLIYDDAHQAIRLINID